MPVPEPHPEPHRPAHADWPSHSVHPALNDRLPLPWADAQAEIDHVAQLRSQLKDHLDWSAVRAQCEPWVQRIRAKPPAFWAMEALLQAFPLSSQEGLALMRLAEALLRIPDAETASLLLSDQLSQADFARHQALASGAHPWLETWSARVLHLASQMMHEDQDKRAGAPSVIGGLFHRLGQGTVVNATVRALQLLGRQFVLGQSIESAWKEAQHQTRLDAQAGHRTIWSFDMLGEGARTWADADRYLAAYRHALATLPAHAAQHGPGDLSHRQGLSIKLSALHPRFEAAQHEAVMRELLPRLIPLAELAARRGLLLTLDAEESPRLELQLAVLTQLAAHLDGLTNPPPWDGLGLAVQAYQHRALPLIEALAQLARRHARRLTVRLVKGAYWDAEIKRAQELGLAGYPVYTRKAHTDLSYLACAHALIQHTDWLYPQFATHNSSTQAAIIQLATQAGVPTTAYEWQRLHGMGQGAYEALRLSEPDLAAVRVYAPVGEHRDLLAYLVRRLLENGANASFVHRLGDPAVPLDELLASPLVPTALDGDPAALPSPRHLYGPQRRNAEGRDLNCEVHRQPLLQAVQWRASQAVATPLPPLDSPLAAADEAARAASAMHVLAQSWPAWEATPLPARCAILERAADMLEAHMDSWAADLVVEARKTLSDAVAEVRETIDYARYYAQQARLSLAPQDLPGPTGEHNEWRMRGRGVFVCIAPWNFPLAIFGGQVMAALVAGNAVAAKPAEATPLIGQRLVALLHEAGVPRDALACLCGTGGVVGTALVASPHCAGVAFTGSHATAKRIQQLLVAADKPIVPFIAETGGVNAMVVDSTALPEQVIDAVLASAFLSAGQRCSALRLLCVHEAVASHLEAMLAGALGTLVVGDPAQWQTDIGPVIDQTAQARLLAHTTELDHLASQVDSGVRLIARLAVPTTAPAAQTSHASPATAVAYVAPAAYALSRVDQLTEEHFGPILHVVPWGPGTAAPDLDTLMAQINASGFGLTLGLHTRLDDRARRVAQLARVGNIYVNRAMTGAVVGVQPFGGQGWSGTGPKAGGPHYLLRFGCEQVVSNNTAAAGGNAALLTQIT